ncbi:hypothetical protein F5X99DRAFT_372086 [Biscogniauxia marginata]|nr:hypothetical protein F5X99DRAFT_372086 [Biscogniauxia marginata]
MASPQKMTGHRDGSNKPEDTQKTIGWEPAKYQRYYATRALPNPPRPKSSSSSIYDLEDGIRRQPTPRYQVINSQHHADLTDTSCSGPFDEAVFKLIRSQPTTRPPRLHTQQAVASSQLRKPDHPDLYNPREHDEAGISPVTPPGTGKTWGPAQTVSPLSEAASELGQTLNVGQADRRHSEFGRSPRMTDLSELHHHQFQKINSRFSDPGSPHSARGFGEPALDISSPFPFNAVSGIQPPERTIALAEGNSHPGGGKSTTSSAASRPQVSFAGAKIASFSNRSQPTGSPSRMIPPPLRLGKQSLPKTPVKTPFPPRAGPGPPQISAPENDSPGTLKKPHRVSSFGSLRIPHRTGSLRRTEPAKSTPSAVAQEARPIDVLARASPVPKVRNILSKARLGLGISSDEEKKERKKDDLKRKIRLTP